MKNPKSFILFLFAALFTCATLSAQDSAAVTGKENRWYNGVRLTGIADGRKVNGINLSLSNESGNMQPGIVNGVDFSLLFSGIDRVNGVHITPGIAYNSKTNGIGIAGLGASFDQMNGLMLSGLFGIVDGKCNGVNISAIGAYSEQMNGIAFGTLVAGADSMFNGICITPLFAWTGKTNGIAIGGVLQYSEGLNGISVGAFNFNDGTTKGLQIGGYNRTDTLRGVQIGLWNVVRSNPRGLRRLPFFNIGLSRLVRRPAGKD